MRLLAGPIAMQTSLQTLYLSWNRLGATGGEHIGLVLRSLTGLQTLNLRGNEFEATGGEHIGLALRSARPHADFYIA